MLTNIKKNIHYHFIGIGGIGMSALAGILKKWGYKVSGCDLDTTQRTTLFLDNFGCKIASFHGSKTCFDKSIDIFIYSTAIPKNNPDVVFAQKNNIEIIHRSDLLAQLTNTTYNIAITGSHGKTTTTSLLGYLLLKAKFRPTILSGGHILNINSNWKAGSGKYFITEADESDRSFLKLNPSIGIITNIDYEHAETYSNLEDIKNTYKQFINKILQNDLLITCTDNIHIKSIIKDIHKKTIRYGFSNDTDVKIVDYKELTNKTIFCLSNNPNIIYQTKLFGKHNILNATAAIITCQYLAIDNRVIAKALAAFKGVDRRYSVRGKYLGATVIDDYAHHPEEIKRVIQVAQAKTKGKLVVIFQPHRYTRTHALWNDFISLFNQLNIDKLFITDIYPASEKPIPNISGKTLAQQIKNCSYIPYKKLFSNKKFIDNFMSDHNNINKSTILILGAGDVWKLSNILIQTNQK